jgi:hypothetical protein
MRHSCEHFRTIEDMVDPAQSHPAVLNQQIRRNLRGDVQVSFQEFTTGPLRFDCTISLIYKYDNPRTGSLESILARLAEYQAVRQVFTGYVGSLKTSMRRNACDQSGYKVQDEARMPDPTGMMVTINTMNLYDSDGSPYGEVLFNTQICTKEHWTAYFP